MNSQQNGSSFCVVPCSHVFRIFPHISFLVWLPGVIYPTQTAEIGHHTRHPSCEYSISLAELLVEMHFWFLDFEMVQLFRCNPKGSPITCCLALRALRARALRASKPASMLSGYPKGCQSMQLLHCQYCMLITAFPKCEDKIMKIIWLFYLQNVIFCTSMTCWYGNSNLSLIHYKDAILPV